MTTAEAPAIPAHPSKFSKAILAQLRRMLAAERARCGRALSVLDPFAGVGLVHALAEEGIETVGVEIQPEWAAVHERTWCGNVVDVAAMFPGRLFDVIATSPAYGNRMADSHDAREVCQACGGSGSFRLQNTTEGYPPQECQACDGKGSRDYERNTYAHKLRAGGAEPVASDDNAQVMQWGARYRSFHERAWRACDHALTPGGLVLLNVKNHYRTIRGRQEEQRVVEFHVNCWLLLGYTLQEARPIPTRGLAQGANHDVRTAAELIVALRKPS